MAQYQYKQLDNKHHMAEAATDFAAEVVAMASELKRENSSFDALELAQHMDDQEINMD